jgi:hypothetical protein
MTEGLIGGMNISEIWNAKHNYATFVVVIVVVVVAPAVSVITEYYSNMNVVSYRPILNI